MSGERRNVLVLGGTPEAAAIAEALAARDTLHVVTSIAGRKDGVAAPAAGDVRIGGFADAQALADFVRERGVALLVDASDPFQPALRLHAAEVALHTGVRRLVFERPACEEQEDDVRIRVRHCAEAADLLPGLASRVLLELPVTELQVFARLQGVWFVLRSAPAAGEPVPLPRYETLPRPAGTSVEDEQALLEKHRVDLLVLRENGAEECARLLLAARRLGLPAMLLERPPLPPSLVVRRVQSVLDWVDGRPLEDTQELRIGERARGR